MKQITLIAPDNQRKFSTGVIRDLDELCKSFGIKLNTIHVKKRSLSSLTKILAAKGSIICLSLLLPKITRIIIALKKNKLLWITFGGDVYSKKYSRFEQKFLISKFKLVSCTSDLEKSLFVNHYGLLGVTQINLPVYDDDGFPIYKEVQKYLGENNIRSRIKNSPLKIGIGNNGYRTQRFEDVLDFLSNLPEDLEIKIFCAYGDKDYIDHIKTTYRHLQIKFIENMVSKVDYIKYLDEQDVLIFNNNRQQGLQSIIIALSLGKTVYISNDNSAHDLLSQHDLIFQKWPPNENSLNKITAMESDKNIAQSRVLTGNQQFISQIKKVIKCA